MTHWAMETEQLFLHYWAEAEAEMHSAHRRYHEMHSPRLDVLRFVASRFAAELDMERFCFAGSADLLGRANRTEAARESRSTSTSAMGSDDTDSNSDADSDTDSDCDSDTAAAGAIAAAVERTSGALEAVAEAEGSGGSAARSSRCASSGASTSPTR